MWRYAKSNLYGVVLVLAVIGIISPAIATATREIQTNICGDFVAPTIASPTPGFTTEDDSVTVAGQGEPSLPVTIINNGVAVAVTTVASSGDYSISVPLSGGSNAITAKEVNACGSAKESDPATVQRNIVSQSPTVNEPVGQEPTSPASITPVVSEQSSSGSLGQSVPTHQNTPGFYAPVITQPTPGANYTVNTVWVAGTTEPLSLVTIYINGVSVARLRASSAGTFGATVELNIGRNSIQVGAEKDGKSAISEATTVMYTPKKSAEKGTLPLQVVGLVAGMTAAAVTVTGGGVWVVKFITSRRLR